jgi:hypothetical protein
MSVFVLTFTLLCRINCRDGWEIPSMCDRLPAIQERQEGSGDRDEIGETEHALMDFLRHRAELL